MHFTTLEFIFAILVLPVIVYACYLILGCIYDEFKKHGFKKGFLLVIFLVTSIILSCFVEDFGYKILYFLIGDSFIGAFLLGVSVLAALIIYSIKHRE